MKKSEMPTLAQAVYIRDTAIELGVTREMFQTLHDDGTWTKVLKELRYQTFELKAMVRQDRPFIEALEAGGPDTLSISNVHKVGGLYPPITDQEEDVEFVLRNFPKDDGGWNKALFWAAYHGYKLTNPREAFAVTEQHDLLKLLDRHWINLVATTTCSFNGCSMAVHIYVNKWHRAARLDMLKCFSLSSDWFLFRK